MNRLEQLPDIANEMLGGLHAGNALKERVYIAAKEQTTRRAWWMRPAIRIGVPAMACALVLAVGAARLLGGTNGIRTGLPAQVNTGKMGASLPDGVGESYLVGNADLPAGSIQLSNADAPKYKSILASGEGGNFPLVGVSGRAYRMVSTPKSLKESRLGEQVGTVGLNTSEPSMASGSDWSAALSNAADEGAAVYAISGVSQKTAVATEVDGQMRVFQRVSYAGYGVGGDSLESTLDVRGKVSSLTLSGVGKIEDSGKANDLVAVLLDNATSYSDDFSSSKQSLLIALDNGLTLQMNVSGEVLYGCGGWSCPEFFEAFQEAL